MQLVIFAGGLGTRLSEETNLKPKPMLLIGAEPILWHIIKIYSHYKIRDFIICSGYKNEVITQYFKQLNNSNEINKNNESVTFKITINNDINWKVTVLNTGLNTQTGGRLLRAKPYINSTFCLTYGDGLSNININDLIQYHKDNSKMITITGINPLSKYGMITANDKNVLTSFKQKPLLKNHIVNAGFFVCEKKIIDFLSSDEDEFENTVLEILADRNEIMLYKHNDFWACMDTQRDKDYLNDLWNSNNAKWKIWTD